VPGRLHLPRRWWGRPAEGGRRRSRAGAGGQRVRRRRWLHPHHRGDHRAIFRRNGVPVIGLDGIPLQEYNSPVEYSFAASPIGYGSSIANEANRLGYKRLAVFYLDFDFTQAAYQALKEAAARNGQQIVYTNAENIASASYGTDALTAKNANPDVVLNILDANSAVREISAMASNGWYPNLIGTTSSSDPVVIQQESSWMSHPGHSIYSERNYYPASSKLPW
jgi:ABC-type branched-subunit amino acid transport system substrate-binding protein